ncbi:MAG: undecaprenyl-diphosphate phosphatase [Butyrivibrio sp.]|jgi:undecaprenyl-diphosphatase|nr:undecaprenyl-diphosphate phosphatase [Butyrivibrio sp.]
MIDILKAILFGIVEGITEWLPISSTGHMILLNEFVKMNVKPDFWDVFLVVIQLGAILAVVLLFWDKIFPFDFSKKARETHTVNRKDIWMLWAKILVACIPAAVVGLAFGDLLDKYLYNGICVSIALIVFGIGFIVIENSNKGKKPVIRSIKDIDFKTALIIGIFQLIAAIFPGTSRSGATILGGLMIGVSRSVAAEFTFFLAIPVMFGASLLKVVKYGFAFSGMEAAILLTGMIVAFVVSVIVIRFLMSYIRKHDFKVFGWYRIVLGVIVIACYFMGILS